MKTKKTDALLEALGERIKTERKKKGMTLERLAYEMGISKGNLSDIEHGKRDPRFTTLRAVARGLAVPISQIFKDLP